MTPQTLFFRNNSDFCRKGGNLRCPLVPIVDKNFENTFASHTMQDVERQRETRRRTFSECLGEILGRRCGWCCELIGLSIACFPIVFATIALIVYDDDDGVSFTDAFGISGSANPLNFRYFQTNYRQTASQFLSIYTFIFRPQSNRHPVGRGGCRRTGFRRIRFSASLQANAGCLRIHHEQRNLFHNELGDQHFIIISV
jgi:hypothetical protein